MKRKLCIVMLLIGVVCACVIKVEAAGNMLDKIIDQGTNFSGSTNDPLGVKLSNFIKGDIMTIVLAIGNLVFAIATVVLGAKYIWSSAEGKSQVAETLPGFIVAVVFFYLGGTLVNWLRDASSQITSSHNWSSVSGYIMWIVNTIVRYASFGGILFMGLKYMFASADGRSRMKTSMGGLVIGIAFVFLASTVVDYIISIGESVL